MKGRPPAAASGAGVNPDGSVNAAAGWLFCRAVAGQWDRRPAGPPGRSLASLLAAWATAEPAHEAPAPMPWSPAPKSCSPSLSLNSTGIKACRCRQRCRTSQKKNLSPATTSRIGELNALSQLLQPRTRRHHLSKMTGMTLISEEEV